MTMLYLSWDPVGYGTITGVQGRYFIPIAPLFFLVFQRGFRHTSVQRWKNKVFAAYAIASLSCSVYMLISRYYI